MDRIPYYVKLIKSNDNKHKYEMEFYNKGKKYLRKTLFGAFGMSDYTIHKDDERKKRYLLRHAGMNENYNDFESAGSLSKFILWNKKTLKESYDDYLKRFKLKNI